MAKIRIGFSTAFELENELVGIGTDNPTNTLQALGNIQSSDAKAIGVSTFTTFDGFTDTKLSLQGSAGAKQHTTSGEIIIEGEVTVSSGTTFTSGPKNLTVTNKFTLPKKTTYAPTVGSTRFNENLGSLEFYTGTEWRAVNSIVDSGNRGRAVHNNHNNISSFNLITGGKTTNFGTSVTDRTQGGAFSSSTRGIFVGDSGMSTDMEYVTIASEGSGIDFGNSSQGRRYGSGCSSSTRGLYACGRTPSSVNTIDYVEIPTVGDAIDFGDLSFSSKTYNSGCGSPTRGLFCNTQNEPGGGEIDKVTIASKGNGTDFGSSGFSGGYFGGTSNSVRALFGGRRTPGQGLSVGDVNTVIIASDGNGTYFGELTEARVFASATSSQTRGVWMGGKLQQSPLTETYTTRIDSFNFDSAGNAVSFGDLSYVHTDGRTDLTCATSDCHGGLGGF